MFDAEAEAKRSNSNQEVGCYISSEVDDRQIVCLSCVIILRIGESMALQSPFHNRQSVDDTLMK